MPDGAAEQPAKTPPGLRIDSGDLVEISVYGVPELKQDLRVNAAGDISLPLVGLVRVAGLTSEEAQTRIEKRLLEAGLLNEPHVSVFIKEYATQGISVLGEVERPGIYPLLGTRRLFDALSAAGGLTAKAGRVVTITRRDRPREPILVTLSRDPSTVLEANLEVSPGDTIIVSKAGVVYVVGEVAKPSGFVMDRNDNLTVLQAIALAEGAKTTAALDRTKLIRRNANGYEEIPIPLKKILEARAPDVVLQAEDIVFVPTSFGKSAGKRSLEAIIQIATGVAIFRR